MECVQRIKKHPGFKKDEKYFSSMHNLPKVWFLLVNNAEVYSLPKSEHNTSEQYVQNFPQNTRTAVESLEALSSSLEARSGSVLCLVY